MAFPQAVHDHLDDYLEKTTISSGSFQLPSDLETPFLEFATANIFPGPQETRLIGAIVSERDAQLSALVSQIQNVKSAIQKLTTIHARLEKNYHHVHRSLVAHRALAAPARRISLDVWGEVFYHCLPDELHVTPRANECPLVLIRVCRSWRAVAMSTPRLWSSLSINLRIGRRDAYRSGTEAWLARAKSVPLTLLVSNEDSITSSSVIEEWLRPFITHCKDLSWLGSSSPIFFLSKAETDLPIERLRLTSCASFHEIFRSNSLKRLRSVYLVCIGNLSRFLNSDLPWDQLVELKMEHMQFDSLLFLQLLTRCSRLCTLAVPILDVNDRNDPLHALPQGSTVHPMLRRLKFGMVLPSTMEFIFEVLTLPALEELNVFCYFSNSWNHAAFMKMIGRSRCPLKLLTVQSHKPTLAVEYVQEYVEAMPGLVVSAS